jgi:hypothetical protein
MMEWLTATGDVSCPSPQLGPAKYAGALREVPSDQALEKGRGALIRVTGPSACSADAWHPATPAERAMWILMYVFSYSVNPSVTNDRAEWRLVPTVVFQEFSNEERCKAAKSKLEDSLKEAGAKLRTGLEDLRRAGAGDPGQIIIAYDVECPSK